jgi:hypothetical protein
VRETVATGYHRLTSAWDRVCNVFGAITGNREKGPSPQDLRAIEAYLLYMPYVTEQPTPDAFVYGHTHVPGSWTVGGKTSGLPQVAVYNPGSFVPPADKRASMLFLHPETGGMKTEFVYFRR